jgi:hypothetical protein
MSISSIEGAKWSCRREKKKSITPMKKGYSFSGGGAPSAETGCYLIVFASLSEALDDVYATIR